jgi:hypothetical protein
MGDGFLLAGDVDDEKAFGSVGFDDTDGLLAVAGFDDVGFVVAGERVGGEEDAFEQITLGANRTDLAEIRADGAADLANLVAGDAGAFAGLEVLFPFRGVAAGDDFVRQRAELALLSLGGGCGSVVSRENDGLENLRWQIGQRGAVQTLLLAGDGRIFRDLAGECLRRSRCPCGV